MSVRKYNIQNSWKKQSINKDNVSNKSLVKIFEHLFGYSPIAHRANSDVKMLIMIMKKLGITSEKIINILN